MGNAHPSGEFTPSHVKTGVGRPILAHMSGTVGGINGGHGGVLWRGWREGRRNEIPLIYPDLVVAGADHL